MKTPIASALANAGLDLNPIIEGNTVIVPIPKTTKETRENLVKIARQQAEKSKQRILKIRRDEISRLKKMKTDKDIGEDDCFAFQKEVESLSETFTKNVADTLQQKETGIMDS